MEERTSIRSVPSLTLFQRSSVGPSKLRKREKDHNERGDFWLLVKCAGAIIASALFFLLLAVLIVIFGSDTDKASASKSTCKLQDQWIGDGICDANANTEECNFDGGDCICIVEDTFVHGVIARTLYFGRYENRSVSSFQTIANCQAPTTKNCMAKCVFTEQCVGYIHGSKNEMSCELISEAKIADQGSQVVAVINADVAKLNEITHVMMVSTQDGSMQELSTNRLVSPATPNVYSVWPAIGSNVPYVFVPNKTLLSGEGLGSGQRLVKWSFSEVPPTYDNHRAMKLKHDENSMFAQQDGKLFIMAGSESNTAEYFENDEWTIVKPYKSILYDACLTFIPRHPDRVYIIGGHNGTAINNDIEYYEFSSNTYYALTSIPGIPNIRALGCTGYITVSQLRSLVMIGGIVSDSIYTKIVRMYNLDRDLWSTLTSYWSKITYPTVLTITVQSKAYIYIFGGERPSALTVSEPIKDVMRIAPSDEKESSPSGAAGGNWYKVGSMNHGGQRSIVVPYPGTIWLRHQDKTSIIYQEVNSFEQIWSSEFDATASRKGSIWTPVNFKDDYYCSLGDLFKDNYGYPSEPAILVKALRADATIHPSLFHKVWSNEGTSSAYKPLVIYRMTAQEGYTCLGGIGINDFAAKPDRKKYCCVREEFLTVGDVNLAWNNEGILSGTMFSAWTVEQNQYDSFGKPGGTFIPKKNYLQPSLGYLLKIDGFEVAKERALQLIQVYDIQEVFNDGETGASKEVSIWSVNLPKGYKSLGHLAVNSRNRPEYGYAVTSLADNVFADPLGFEKIWEHLEPNRGIWKPLCPEGYGAVGHIAGSATTLPEGDNTKMVTCINDGYLTSSTQNWKKVWTDAGTQAEDSVALYRLEALTKDEIGDVAMFAVGSYYTFPPNPKLLKAQNVNLVNN